MPSGTSATRVALEICVDNPQSITAAATGGADRLELCSALGVGGLTPSPALIDHALQSGLPVHAMIRPRDGDFEYSETELQLMESEIRYCATKGLSGVVFGATRGAELDQKAMARLIAVAGTMEVTLHRAFDVLDDPIAALDVAADLGVARILTSGGTETAEEGMPAIKACVDHAAGRLTIMAGGGVGVKNASRIIRETGITAVHGSLSRPSRSFDQRLGHLGMISRPDLMTTDPALVRQIKSVLNSL